MAPDKHALFAQLSVLTRTAIHAASVKGGVPLDDLMQALLARYAPRNPTYAKALGEVASSVPEEAAEEARRALSGSWPQPEHTAAEQARELEAQRAITVDEKVAASGPITTGAILISGGALAPGAAEKIAAALTPVDPVAS